MYEIMIKLIVAAAILELGITLSHYGECTSRECLSMLERASRQVLHVDWKPISVFPEEARRLREASTARQSCAK